MCGWYPVEVEIGVKNDEAIGRETERKRSGGHIAVAPSTDRAIREAATRL